ADAAALELVAGTGRLPGRPAARGVPRPARGGRRRAARAGRRSSRRAPGRRHDRRDRVQPGDRPSPGSPRGRSGGHRRRPRHLPEARRSERRLVTVPAAAAAPPEVGSERYRWVVLAIGTTAQGVMAGLLQAVAVLSPALRDHYHLSLGGVG